MEGGRIVIGVWNRINGAGPIYKATKCFSFCLYIWALHRGEKGEEKKTLFFKGSARHILSVMGLSRPTSLLLLHQ